MRWLLRPPHLAILALALVLGYTLVGFFLLPYIIKAHVIPSIAEQIRRPVSVADVEMNPFALSIRMIGFDIRELDQSPVIGFEELFINLQAISLLRRAYVFDSIRLVLPYVSAKMSKEGRLNLLDLLPPDDEPKPAAPPQAEQTSSPVPAIQIGDFEIAQGVVEFRDESKPKPYVLDIVPIRIALKNFHTKPGGDNSYAFTAELGKGETLAWEGTISLEPIRSSGKFILSGVKLHSLWRYLQDRFRFTITDGLVTADAMYTLDTGANPVLIQITRANTQIENLKITEEDGLDPVIVIPMVKVEGVDVDLAKQDLTVANVSVEQASWTTWLNPDGTVNYQQLFAPVTSTQPASPPASASSPRKEGKPWLVLLKQITLKDHAIDFEDRSLQPPAQIKIASLTAETSDVHLPLQGPLPLSVTMQINDTGQIHVKGSVAPNPFQVDLTLGLKEIAIRPFQAYFEKFARIDVLSGAVNVDGQLHLAVQHPRGPFLSYEGNANVTRLAIADRDQEDEVASMKRLSLNTIHLTVDPTSLSIHEVGLQEPSVHLVVQSEGRLNLAKLRSSEPSSSTDQKFAPTRKSKSAPVPVTIGTVKLLKAAATFRDETVQPPVSTGISDFTGTIKGLSSKQVARAGVDLAGRVDRVAPLKIAGTINPLSENTFTDLAITFDNVDLTAGGPYSGKYVGYGLSKGKLFLDLKYKVSQKQLEAENKVVVDQLTFGEKTNSPDATSLPVPLAVALLKDRKGRIEIDLPIRGDLNDPDFKYGKVVFSTLGNLLTKIVASPFALMGKLVPGGGTGEDLQFIEFQPGSATVAGEEVKKIETLAKALDERPGLRLDITGGADPAIDRKALAARKLKDQLMVMKQRAVGQASMKHDDLLSEDEQRFVAELYEQRRDQLGKFAPAQPDAGIPKPLTVEEMKQRLAAAIPVEEVELRALARQRAEQVRDQLVEVGKLAEERVYLLEVNPTASGYEKVRSQLTIAAGS